MSQNIDALKKSESTQQKDLSSNPSFSNLYNSTSQKGSNTTLNMSNSAVFNNGLGLVQKGTVAHVNKNSTTSNLNPHNNNNSNSNSNNNDDGDEDDEEEEDDGTFELNWKPQVSSDNNYTSGYHDRV
ncbi:hypothetical protein C6P40_004477 [Pichia californica]|uniref:Uncharacterized protein n=1 Tax=Pichia californica TaxID=460514 RepID=A0A9P6WHT8_9ASCO|nr:hypothetical protein C6P42_002014 [[Candida] californica]KAG0686323.1 hypothetical protein C6P40_004477 [[Candida] californica]